MIGQLPARLFRGPLRYGSHARLGNPISLLIPVCLVKLTVIGRENRDPIFPPIAERPLE